MRRIVFRHVLAACSVQLAAASPAAAQSPTETGYHVLRSIHLGGDGGWDYIAFDSAGHRLFIAHQTRVEVVDPEAGVLLGEITGLDGAHGIALDPGVGHGFATSGRDSRVTMFDLRTLQVERRIAAGEGDDAILYDPASRRVFTFNGAAASSTVIDPASGDVIGTIRLGGRPEFGVSAGGGRLYVNLEDSGAVAEIDAAGLRVTRRWPLATCRSPTGLAIDRTHQLLFSGCRNGVMAISDASAGKVIATVPIGQGVDGCVFDPGPGLAFASNGDGSLTVVHEDSPTAFHVVATVPTHRGARTVALDPATHRLYTVTADFGPPPAPTRDRPRPRPGIVPGSFTLLVIGT
jgi:DNA-binding beta-propeller fold protein YncE